VTRPRILILLGAYWPGHDSSGPNLSVRAMCEALSGWFDFSIVARDRPFGASVPMTGNGWHDLGFARARYLPVGRTGAGGLGALLESTPHDVLLLNGFFDREFTIPALLHRRRKGARGAVLLSPRGEFSSGALGLKGLPKRLYRHFTALAGLLRGVTLHATSPAELADLQRAFPGREIPLIPNFRPMFPLPPHRPRAPGEALRIAYIGRISPVKGTDIALRALAMTSRAAHFDIFEIANAEVADAMAAHDLMLLPSLSENFGHGIFEALAAGTPVLIGDRTPWRGLEVRQAGFDLPTADIAAFARAIDRVADFTAAEIAAWRDGARAVAEKYVTASPALADMRALLQNLAGETAR
jgi:glycosyltransferase involved in cell wall biosynthesis